MFASHQKSNQSSYNLILALISNCIYWNQRFGCTAKDVPSFCGPADEVVAGKKLALH